jgi:hypothetical protein
MWTRKLRSREESGLSNIVSSTLVCLTYLTQRKRELEEQKKIGEQKTAEITAARKTNSEDIEKALALREKEARALIGYTWCNIVEDDTVTFDFGRWNDRWLDSTQARGIADEMRNGVKRFDIGSMLKVPVTLTDLKVDKLEEVRATTKISAIQLSREGKNIRGLQYLGDVLKQDVRRLHPVGGQHRQKAMKLFLEYVEKQLVEAGLKLAEYEPELSEYSGRALSAITMELELLTQRVASLKAEKNEGGSWLVALYDQCTLLCALILSH